MHAYQEAQQSSEAGPQDDPDNDPSHAGRRQVGAAAGAAQDAVHAQQQHRDCGVQVTCAGVPCQVLVSACSHACSRSSARRTSEHMSTI